MAVIPADLALQTRRRLSRFATRLAGLVGGAAARARRTSRIVRARAGYAAGVATGSWGVGVQFGLGWALMAGGTVMAVSFLLLYPVEEPGQ